ncbi:MAG: GAF domain-containing protein, partial [Roseiflexaceae bacterium]|nr:GAF domain-containing protein [Roseiflexaceae bacterium]
ARLRASNDPQSILEETARAVQASGSYTCVTLSMVDQITGIAAVKVAIGASGRRLAAVEGLEFPWRALDAQLTEQRTAASGAYLLDLLPFRSIGGELHVVLPLRSQRGVEGVLTASNARAQRARLDEAAPLLALLANQAVAVLEHSQLYATLQQQVVEVAETASHSREQLAHALDRAETLYQLVHTLARTLDEREVLAQALELLKRAAGAEWGGILLIEPNTGHLAVRHGFEGLSTLAMERLYELSGVVIAERRMLLVGDIRAETRWPSDEPTQAVLLAPLLLDDEALGTLVLCHGTAGAFTAEHALLARAGGDQIAVALSKVQLYRYVSEQSEQLGHTLQQREEEILKNHAILSSIGEGVVVADRRNYIRLINPAAEQLLGISAQHFIGRHIRDLPGVPQQPNEDLPNAPVQVALGEQTLHAHYAPVLAPSGERLGGVVVYHDITREVTADKLKSSFIATASHELRTPLTSIRGYVDLLLLGTIGPLSQPQRDFLKVVKHNVVQIVELVDDLLDASKVEVGEVQLRRVSLEIGELVYDVSESLYAQFAEKSILLTLDIAPELPAVMADRQRLRQIIVNLVGNACKYTPQGGRVEVIAWLEGDQLRLDVRDTGVGIARDAQANIFTPFFRADNPLREVAGGTGLGLSITKTLVELHGGRIWFDSTEGQGTVFSFVLPLNGYEWAQPAWLETHDV